MEWGKSRRISDHLSLEVVAAQHAAGLKVNNYVLSTPDLRVFYGSEALDLEPLREYRNHDNRPRIDIVLAPVNGVHLLRFLKLVMNGQEAVEATRILGASTLVPIHDSQIHVPLLFRVTSSGADAEEEANLVDENIEVVRLVSGQRWEYRQWQATSKCLKEWPTG